VVSGIEANWSKTYPETPWASDVKAADFPENYADRLELIAQPIETAATENKFDIVCSFQVGEHISDLDAFALMNRRLLEKPNGVACTALISVRTTVGSGIVIR
jgi:2-polyprenyl-3-methyl-5-hydroxy-6-metoxy-1,4-benzoquinol methylase